MRRGVRLCALAGLIGVAFLLAVAGCGDGRPGTSETGESSATVGPAAAPVSDAEAEPGVTPVESPDRPAPEASPESAVVEPSALSEVEPAVEEVLIGWERQGGPDSRCDRMSIYPDRRVVAVRCAGSAEGTLVESVLSEEQAAQLDEWIDRFGSFSRRESDVTGAVMRTVFEGRGEATPSTEEKTAVARFSKQLFLALASEGSP